MYDYGHNIPYSYCPIDYYFLKDLEEYIYDEIKDSRYYEILSKKAPNKLSKSILAEFSSDERRHSENFMNAYLMLTGRMYMPPAIEDPSVPKYKDALNERVIAETNDYKKYGEKYLQVDYPYLKDLFFMTRTDEAIHAIRMQILYNNMN